MNISKRFISILAVLAVGGACWWFWPSERAIRNFPPTKVGVAVFGDSLMHGTGTNNPKTEGPAAILSNYFDIDVRSFGVPGDTTDRAMIRIPQVLAIDPGLVIICLGGNDYLHRTNREEIFGNLRKIIRQFQDAGACVCIVGLEPTTTIGYTYKREFKDLAYTTESLLVPDALRGILDSPGMRADRLHPNKEGYLLMTDRIIEVIEPAVREIKNLAASRKTGTSP